MSVITIARKEMSIVSKLLDKIEIRSVLHILDKLSQ